MWLSLTEEEAAAEVVTHSSDNHAQALALAAQRGIPAHIVMPSNAQVKQDAVAGYGAQVVLCEPTLQAEISGRSRCRDRRGIHSPL